MKNSLTILYTLSAESFARLKNREIFDINFRELGKKMFFAIINFRESRENKKLKQVFSSEEHLFNVISRCFLQKKDQI